MFPANKEAEMRVIFPTLVGLAALAAVSAHAVPIPSKPYPHETPAQNVWKSEQYDHLLRTNGGFRAYRMKKECGPIKDPGLRNSCIASFSAYEPVRR
jgi:hypothetical protein